MSDHPSQSQPLPPTVRLSGTPVRSPSHALSPGAPAAPPARGLGRAQVIPQFPPRRPRPPAGRFSFLRSLRWRLAFAFVGFLAMAFVLLAVFLFLTLRPYLRGEALNSTLVGAAKLLSSHKSTFNTALAIDLGAPSPAFEHTIGEAIDGLSDVQQVMMVDPRTGTVVAGIPNSLIGQKAPQIGRA